MIQRILLALCLAGRSSVPMKSRLCSVPDEVARRALQSDCAGAVTDSALSFTPR